MANRPQNCAVTADPGLTVAAVARRLGVAPATLRTWDRRYGVGPSEHQAGAHRRYNAADLARLEHMRRLVVAGVPPVDAAREALESDTALATVTPISVRAPLRLAESPAPDARPGGGSVVPMPGASAQARGLARAAMTLDGATCGAIIDAAIVDRGVIETWDELILPVLSAIGDRWRDTGRGIEVEHTLSGAVMVSLGRVISDLHSPVNVRTVLLVPADHEWHTLPLWAVAAALAERQIGAQLMTDPLPAASLVQAVHRLGPAAVLIWSQLSTSGSIAALTSLPRFRPAPRVLLGGSGWPEDLPAGVERLPDLTGAVARIAHALGE